MKKELTPTSDVDKATLIGDEYVSQVRTFGALGYHSPSHLLSSRSPWKREDSSNHPPCHAR